MPVRKMTDQEAEEIFGNGLLVPGKNLQNKAEESVKQTLTQMQDETDERASGFYRLFKMLHQSRGYTDEFKESLKLRIGEHDQEK